MGKRGLDVARLSQQFLDKHWANRNTPDNVWNVSLHTSMLADFARTVAIACIWAAGKGEPRTPYPENTSQHIAYGNGRHDAVLAIRRALRRRNHGK